MSRRRESGVSLTIALVALFVTAASAAALFATTERTARSNSAERGRLAARYAAEAGVERARWAIGRDSAYEGERMQFDGFDVTIDAVGQHAEERCVIVEVTGSRGKSRVEATLREAPGLPVVIRWNDW
jgi:Tfp pilus assembly protein PilV